MGETLYKSFPVTEIGESGDDVTVLGKCSDGELDSDGDIVSPAFMAQAVKTWLRVCPSVYREHSPGHPAGMGIDAWQDDTGATWVKSRISDDESKALTRSGRLKAYSVGIRDPETRKSARCPRFEIVGGRLTEVSIVSAPANARCGVKIIGKSASGVPEYIGKAFVIGESHGSVLRNCSCGTCMAGRKSCGCPECRSVTKSVKAVRKMASRSGAAVEEMLRSQMRVALDSADPWQREMARKALSAGE